MELRAVLARWFRGSPMKFCCAGFQAKHGHRHERGLFVYVMPPVPGVSAEPSFHIGMRALERDRYDSLRDAVKGVSGPISLSVSTGMRYCPWCGATLAKFYRRNWPGLIDEKIVEEFKLPAA